MPKKKNQPKPATEKIDFPAEDQGWIALQQRVIELAGKPVEDLEWNDVAKVSEQLAPPEQDTLRKYWLRIKQEQEKHSPPAVTGKPSTAVPKWVNWEDQRCNKTFEWIVDFQGDIRAIAVRLAYINLQQEINSYAAILDWMKKELLEWLPSDAISEDSNIISFLLCNIDNVFPTDEGYELLKGFYERLAAREAELKKERMMAITASPTPPVATATPSPQPKSKPESDEKERMTVAEAFALNDNDNDDERAIRAAGLLLEWAAEFGNDAVDGFLALGISRTLSMAADHVAQTRRRVKLERQESR